MSDPKRFQQFNRFKHESLNKTDLSLKGSIDEPIRPLVDFINKQEHYYTTSTCSGRITLIEKPYANAGIKKGNNFHLSSHEQLEFTDFNHPIQSFVETSRTHDEDTCLWLKFEPFIMHVQCFDLDRARTLLNIALATGCRNSGLTLGKPDKFMVAIRSTSSMEIPIHCGSRFKINFDYIRFLYEESNRRLAENKAKLDKFQSAIETGLV